MKCKVCWVVEPHTTYVYEVDGFTDAMALVHEQARVKHRTAAIVHVDGEQLLMTWTAPPTTQVIN